jgi:hypothetical protein
VARLEILNAARQQRPGRSLMDSDLDGLVVGEYLRLESELPRRRQLLRFCLKLLPESMSETVRLRYEEGSPLEQIVARLGESLAAVKVIASRPPVAPGVRPHESVDAGGTGMTDDLQTRISAYLNGDLTDEDAERLRRQLSSDPKALTEFVHAMDLHAELRKAFQEGKGTSQALKEIRQAKRFKMRSFVGAIAACAAIAAVVFFFRPGSPAAGSKALA